MKNNIRARLFWGIDRLRSNGVYNHYSDIKYHYFNSTESSSKNMREEYLQDLIKHVSLHVPFYQHLKNASSLSDFPVVNKLTIINNYESFLSAIHPKETMASTTTSGSTGTPFTVYKDRNKVLRHQAENIFFSELAKQSLGSKLYYTRVWNNVNRKSFLERFKTNIVPVEISNLSDENLQGLINRIENEKTQISVLGFASFFEALAKYIEQSGVKIKNSTKINSIITISEALPEDARLVLEDFFACPVYSRYSNMENGFIAQRMGGGDGRYLLNHGSIHIEILDVSADVPVPLGNLGRIVITDYFNYGMPLLRYDTGDLGVLEYDSQFGEYLSKVEGRRTDFIYNTNGDLLSPHVITNTMWNFKDLSQFQFIQLGKQNYKIKLNYKFGVYPHENALIDSIKSFLGNDATIAIEYVDEIPLLSSGKRSKIVNLMSGKR